MMSRLDVKISIRDLIKDNNFKNTFINNIDKIISQYTSDIFIDTLKLSDISRLIDLRSFLSKLFLNFFHIDSDLSLKYRRGEHASSSLAYDIYILSHCLVDQKVSKEIDNIFNINIKPTTFIKKKDEINNKINFIFRAINSIDSTMDHNTQTNNVNLSAEQKLDHILNSLTEIKTNVMNLNSTVEELKIEQNNMKSSLNSKIREVCSDMLNIPSNSHQLSKPSNSQADIYSENNKKKRRVRSGSLSNEENDTNRNPSNIDLNYVNKMIRRKGTYGSNDSTNFKTGIVPFNVYVGNMHLDTKDEEVTHLFQNNGIQVIHQNRIDTRSKFSKAYRITISRDKCNLINDSGLWPKNLILNRFTFSKEEKLSFRSD